MLKQIIVWALAIFFLANTIGYTATANITIATFLMWGISLSLVAYGIFWRTIDIFTGQGIGLALKCALLAGVLMVFGICTILVAGEHANPAKGDEKAIIVLGAGVHGTRLSRVLYLRMVAALDAYHQNPDAMLVVTGGKGPQEDLPEAHAMRDWLLKQGVPLDKIIVEDKSTSTQENLLFSRALLQEHGISADMPVAIVTNGFHCYRAGVYAKALGYSSARAIPSAMSFSSLIPSYLREVLAVVDLWVFQLPKLRA